MNKQQLAGAIDRLWKGDAAIMLVEFDYLLVVVGYAELMAPGRLFYVELSDRGLVRDGIMANLSSLSVLSCDFW